MHVAFGRVRRKTAPTESGVKLERSMENRMPLQHTPFKSLARF